MSEPIPKRFSFDLSGGHLALDFANTVSWRLTDHKERLPNYGALVLWAEQAGVLPRRRTTTLLEQSMRTPAEASAVLQEALALREAIFEIFRAVAEKRPAPQAALGKLNIFLMQGAPFVRLAAQDKAFAWDWETANHRLDAMLWPVARAAADLLTSDALVHVRICDAPDCAWLFLDKTRNHQRRWCDMTTCGNRVKARRHYARMKSAAR